MVHQASCMRRDGFQGPDIAVELRAAPNSVGGVFSELLVTGGEGDTDQLDLIGDVHREQGKYRCALVLAEDAETLASAERIAVRHGLQGKQPGGVTPDAPTLLREHHLGNVR